MIAVNISKFNKQLDQDLKEVRTINKKAAKIATKVEGYRLRKLLIKEKRAPEATVHVHALAG